MSVKQPSQNEKEKSNQKADNKNIIIEQLSNNYDSNDFSSITELLN